MELHWHRYRYLPYERELAIREVQSLLAPDSIEYIHGGVKVLNARQVHRADHLVYFAEVVNNGAVLPTLQSRLESGVSSAKKQSTRYASHGVHEYKGRFNPQVVRAILNVLNVPEQSCILDPFCGSGTSLVECALVGQSAAGADMNPLAVFLANTKIAMLALPASRLRDEAIATAIQCRFQPPPPIGAGDERIAYLLKWFDKEVLAKLEQLKCAIEKAEPACAKVMLTVVSNLLREYSFQDPLDLRIRRRTTPLPEQPLEDAFEDAALRLCASLQESQSVTGILQSDIHAVEADSRKLRLGQNGLPERPFDCVITSPPYATALPYIDTQRLSLVWLGLASPSAILQLEAELVGSREFRGSNHQLWLASMQNNECDLPQPQVELCHVLQRAVSSTDGFRRRAVPSLLYRYFAGMKQMFTAVRSCVSHNSPFALVVGDNHTILGGQRFDIDTPLHLAEIAGSCQWTIQEIFPLQTYQRYGYHTKNAVRTEALVILRAQ